MRTRPPERTIEVTGFAKKHIVSNQIVWSGKVTVVNMDRTAAYRELASHAKAVLAYLLSHGVPDFEVPVGAITVREVWDTETVGSGADRIERKVFRGFRLSQSLNMLSRDVERVERVSQGLTELLDQGVPVSSSEPSCYYTRLWDLKVEMLAQGARDARTRAENILEKAGGARIARLRYADMGVINVNKPNSTKTSWEGNNDTTSLEKDIITVVHVTFELE